MERSDSSDSDLLCSLRQKRSYDSVAALLAEVSHGKAKMRYLAGNSVASENQPLSPVYTSNFYETIYFCVNILICSCRGGNLANFYVTNVIAEKVAR